MIELIMGKIKKFKRTHFTDLKSVWIKGYGSVGAENRIKKLSLKVTYSLSSFRFAAFLQNLSSRLYCDNNRMSPIYLLDCISIWFPWFCRSGGPPNNFSISMTSDNGTRLPHWNCCCAAVQKCFTNVLGKSQESQIQLGHHQKKCIAFSSAFLPTLIGRSYYDFCWSNGLAGGPPK